MKFGEPWGLACLCWGEGEGGKRLSAWPGSYVRKASPDVQEAKTDPFCFSILRFDSIQSLLNTYCVQSAVPGAEEHSEMNKDGSWLPKEPYIPWRDRKIHKLLQNSAKEKAVQRDGVTGLWARLNST